MKPASATLVGTKITNQFLRAIRDHLVDQDFSLDEGEVKLVDSDDATLFFGLFEIDETTGSLKGEPAIIWSIEVFADLQGGR